MAGGKRRWLLTLSVESIAASWRTTRMMKGSEGWTKGENKRWASVLCVAEVLQHAGRNSSHIRKFSRARIYRVSMRTPKRKTRMRWRKSVGKRDARWRCEVRGARVLVFLPCQDESWLSWAYIFFFPRKPVKNGDGGGEIINIAKVGFWWQNYEFWTGKKSGGSATPHTTGIYSVD